MLDWQTDWFQCHVPHVNLPGQKFRPPFVKRLSTRSPILLSHSLAFGCPGLVAFSHPDICICVSVRVCLPGSHKQQSEHKQRCRQSQSSICALPKIKLNKSSRTRSAVKVKRKRKRICLQAEWQKLSRFCLWVWVTNKAIPQPYTITYMQTVYCFDLTSIVNC